MNDLLKLKIEKLPTCPGCYLMKSEGRIIYVGKAVNLKNRVSQYFTHSKAHTVKVRAMVARIDDFDIVKRLLPLSPASMVFMSVICCN